MFSDLEINAIREALRILFLISAPLSVCVLLVATLSSVAQASMSVREPVVSYVLKLIVVVVLLYLLTPLASELIVRLAAQVFS